MDYGHAEAAAKQGADPRTYEVTTKRFERDAAGKVTGVVRRPPPAARRPGRCISPAPAAARCAQPAAARGSI